MSEGFRVPYCGAMASIDEAIAQLVDANRRLGDRDAERETARRERDDAIRVAKSAGATYDAIKTATGLSLDTITKALKR